MKMKKLTKGGSSLRRFLSFVMACICLLTMTLPMTAFAATSTIVLDKKSRDFSALHKLPQEYSYGVLQYNSNTKITPISGTYGNVFYQDAWETRLGIKEGGNIKVKITNCSTDASGNMCDAIVTVDNVKLFNVETSPEYIRNRWNGYFAGNINVDTTRMVLKFGRYNNLITTWLEAYYASARYTITYYKAGTNTVANVPYLTSTLYDMDVPVANMADKLKNEYLGGSEGFFTNNEGAIYYDKNTKWIVDAKNVPSGYYGASAPVPDNCPVASNVIEKETSVVTIQKLKSSSYTFYYSGRSCGLAWVFASPYAFELKPPQKTVSSNTVFEGESFNYKIEQYVPNNYYAGILDFITNSAGSFRSFIIRDRLDSNLKVNGNITVKNDDGKDMTSWFDIVVDENNVVNVTLKSAYLKNSVFYNHTYIVTLPVCIKEGSGVRVGASIKNKAMTFITDGDGPGTVTTEEVPVNLKYNLDISTVIDNGVSYINTPKSTNADNTSAVVAHNSDASNSVVFKAAPKYKITSVFVDGQEVDLNTIPNKDEREDVYIYTFDDKSIKQNISHSVVVNTVLKDASVVINHLSEGGEALCDPETKSGKVDDAYTSSQKEFKEYVIKTVPDNASGIMTEDTIIVNYIYRLKDTSVTAKYIDLDTGKPLCDDVRKDGRVRDDYTTENKAFPSYTLTEIPSNASGKMTVEPIEVIYYYTKNSSDVIANYVDENGTILASQETYQGKVDTPYSTFAKEIEGYNLKTVEGEESGKFKDDTIIVNYIYTLKPATVISNYIDENGKVLEKQEKEKTKWHQQYNTSAKTIYGYELIKVPDNASGVVKSDEVVVNYIYRLKDTKVIAKYITDAGDLLAPDQTKPYKVFDAYKTERKTFYGWELIAVPENADGTTTEETITVTYVYRQKDGIVNVYYEDAEGNNLIEPDESVTINGKVTEHYETEEKTFYGYELVEVPNNAEGYIDEEPINVTYVYKLKDTSVIVNHLKEDGSKLCESETINGKVFDAYETKQKEFYGYRLTSVPENANGVMEESVIVVDYIYVLNNADITVNYVDEAGNPLDEPDKSTVKVGDSYKTTEKEFDNYDLIKVEGEPEGNVPDGGVTVTYIYRLKVGEVVVRFVDTKGNELADFILLSDYVGKDWETSAIDIDGYKLISKTNKVTGKFTLENEEVIFVYDKIVVPAPIPEPTPIAPQTGTSLALSIIAICLCAIAIGCGSYSLSKKPRNKFTKSL